MTKEVSEDVSEIEIEMVGSEEAYEWINDKLRVLKGSDLNHLGTLAVMLEDLTGFVNKSKFTQKQFLKYIREQEEECETLH